jgi:multiple sugar transport system permease protein
MKKLHSRQQSRNIGITVTYIILILSAVICIVPFIWMILTSFKTNAEALRFPPTIFPKKIVLSNYVKGWAQADFSLFTKNTTILALICTTGTVISSALVGYGFAQYNVRGSKFLYIVLLATMMLPAQVTLVPQYLLYSKFKMLDSYWPIIIPALLGGGAYNIFLYQQFFKSMPKELCEAAKIDGANSFQVFSLILFPTVKPVALCVGVMALVYNWNDFYTPLIYLNSTQKYTISIGLQFLNSTQGTAKIGMMMAVAVVTMLPVLIIFFAAQKYFVEGIKITGMKA